MIHHSGPEFNPARTRAFDAPRRAATTARGALLCLGMNSHQPLLTVRLDLRRPDPCGDLADLFAIFNDPNGWWYEPGSRHLESDQTEDWRTRAASRWDTQGLSYWTVRRRDNHKIIGVGGAQRQRTEAWNLYYRLATPERGRGFATELGHAAHAAASMIDSAVPFIAWIAEHNLPSRRVAERLGLRNYGVSVDPSDGQPRLAYADRPIGGFSG
jgi:RimJ/RimL family protein N-acetyltransferase